VDANNRGGFPTGVIIRIRFLGDVSDQNHQELVFQCRVLQVLAEDTGTPAVVRSKGEWYPCEDGE